jgi:hypothetical protein
VTIIRMGRSIPKTLREWDRILEPLNQVINETTEGVTIQADNLPASDAAFVTLSNNASLSGDRVLTGESGQVTITDNGAGSTVDVGLADYGTAGTYTKVVTDPKGRVVAGAALMRTDMPAPLDRFYTGTGTPNGVVVANPGSVYLNVGGGANNTLWVKESGTSNTGWVAK